MPNTDENARHEDAAQQVPSRVVICRFCRKRVHQQRNGAWYHNHNASVSCRPGEGSDRRALPLELVGGTTYR
jgi:hypothetical protein